MNDSKIFELQRKISLANDAYASGSPYLTDYEYDKLWQELRNLDPNNPELYHTSKPRNYTNIVNHPLKVLSLSKAFDEEDLKVFLTRFPKEKLLVQPKYDGVALMLYPVPDNFPYPYRAILSGDGESGRDISHHLPYMKLPDHSGPRLSCEAMIIWDDWSDSLGANPRNVTAGLLARHDISDFSNFISVVPHNQSSIEIDPTSYKLSELSNLLLEIYNDTYKVYPCDGLVLKVKDQKRRLVASHNGTYPLWAIAWKPPMQISQTKVTSVEWNVSRTGRIVPTVYYEPVYLCGTSNNAANGNNYQWIYDRSICPGSKIKVGKAGEIIPQITEVITFGIPEIPEFCPFCKSELKVSGVDLICESPDCLPQKVNQLSYFYGQHGLDIKNIGPKMIEKILHDSTCYKVLSESPWALLQPDHFGISRFVLTIIGEGNFNRFLKSLKAAPSPDLARFMSSLGYPKLGYKTSLWFLHKAKGLSPEGKIPSNEALQSFKKAMPEVSRAIAELNNFKFAPLPDPATIKYSITGDLSIHRNEIISKLNSYGWKFVNSVSGKTDYLILGELEHDSRKLKDAKKHGTKILYESDLNLNSEDSL